MWFDVFLAQMVWPQGVFLVALFITTPLYFLVVWAIIRARKKDDRYRTTYYNLILCQALGDFIALTCYFFSFHIRNWGVFNDFFWANQNILSPVGFNTNQYFLIIRVFGDCLVALQRYIVLCMPSSKLLDKTDKLSFLTVSLIYWFPSTIFALPAIWRWDMGYDSPTTVRTLVSAGYQEFVNLYQIALGFLLFSISFTAYFSVLRLIIKISSTGGLTKEMRLSFIIIGQFIVFLAMIIFFMVQYIYVRLKDQEMVSTVGKYYPLLTGFESFTNPWLHILLNRDLRREVAHMLRGPANRQGRTHPRKINTASDGSSARS